MSARRIALLFLLLLVLATVAAGWLYFSLPAIIASQGREYLSMYGVESIESSQPQLTYGEVRLDDLVLHGRQDGLRFHAALHDMKITYSPGSLALGQLQGVHIGRLALALALPPAGPASEPAQALSLKALLPGSIADLLPVNTLAIDALQLSITSDAMPPLDARGKLAIERELRLQLATHWQAMDLDLALTTGQSPSDTSIAIRATQGDTAVTRLDAHSQLSAEDEWTWQIDSRIEIAPLRRWLSRPGVRSALPAQLGELDTLEPWNADGSVSVTGSVTHADQLDPDTFSEGLWADLAIEGSALRLQRADDKHELLGAFKGRLALSPEHARLSLSSSELRGSVATTRLGLAPATGQSIGWGETSALSWRQTGSATLAWAQGGDVNVQLAGGALEAGSGSAQLALSLGSTNLAFDPAAPQKPLLASAFNIGGSLRGNPLPPVSGTIGLSNEPGGDAQALSLQLTEAAGKLSLSLTGSGAPLDGKGQYKGSVRLEQLAGAIERYLPLLPPGTAPATVPRLRSGNAVLTANIGATGWDAFERWQWRSNLDLRQLALTQDTYTVDGLSLQAAWRGLEQWQTIEPARLAVERIEAGFPIERLSALISLPRPTPPAAPEVRLDELQMSLLGGRAFVPQPQTWDFSGQRNSLALQVEELALADIVALQQNRQISADGRLSGLLPISLNGKRLTIDRGHVTAAAPGGVIRYRPDEASAALAGNSRELGMALQLLGNFHYNVLSSEVALDEGGILLLGLSLAGRNPEYEGGRAVNFNINLEQNIDPLLQSLRLGGSVAKQLEKKRR